MSDTYIDSVLSGSVLWTDIEEWVERWHRERPAEKLHQRLGMTRDEYGLWVEQPRALRIIIAARERNEPVLDLLSRTDDRAIAARGLSAADVQVVREWLQETGRLPSP